VCLIWYPFKGFDWSCQVWHPQKNCYNFDNLTKSRTNPVSSRYVIYPKRLHQKIRWLGSQDGKTCICEKAYGYQCQEVKKKCRCLKAANVKLLVVIACICNENSEVNSMRKAGRIWKDSSSFKISGFNNRWPNPNGIEQKTGRACYHAIIVLDSINGARIYSWVKTYWVTATRNPKRIL